MNEYHLYLNIPEYGNLSIHIVTEKFVSDKEALQIFCPERVTIARGKARSEDEKYGVKPTPAETNFSVTMCIQEVYHGPRRIHRKSA